MIDDPRMNVAMDIDALRAAHYNATVSGIRWLHDDLMIMRVQPDTGDVQFVPGQYTVLGLGNWERRVAGCQEEEAVSDWTPRLIRRAYSISAPMLNSAGVVTLPGEGDFLEFFIALVRRADHPPELTPRLFGLKAGDRLFCGPNRHGRYSLDNVQRANKVLFAATGTGEAPHNAMVAKLLHAGHAGEIVNLTCVRHAFDLGYMETHRQLAHQFRHYHYQPLTTREPENLDESLPGFVGKRYIQDYVQGGLADDFGFDLDPGNTHVFLCGNPAMIGAPQTHGDSAASTGMVKLLENHGFRIDHPHEPGNIHFERFWTDS